MSINRRITQFQEQKNKHEAFVQACDKRIEQLSGGIALGLKIVEASSKANPTKAEFFSSVVKHASLMLEKASKLRDAAAEASLKAGIQVRFLTEKARHESSEAHTQLVQSSKSVSRMFGAPRHLSGETPVNVQQIILKN